MSSKRPSFLPCSLTYSFCINAPVRTNSTRRVSTAPTYNAVATHHARRSCQGEKTNSTATILSGLVELACGHSYIQSIRDESAFQKPYGPKHQPKGPVEASGSRGPRRLVEWSVVSLQARPMCHSPEAGHPTRMADPSLKSPAQMSLATLLLDCVHQMHRKGLLLRHSHLH